MQVIVVLIPTLLLTLSRRDIYENDIKEVKM
jgi:hypothetical protein